MNEKLTRRGISLFVLLSAVCVLVSACGLGESQKPDRLHYPVSDFSFTDQNGQAFGTADLKGKVWVSNFFFSSCTTVCPLETANMAMLQGKMKDAGVPVEFVSFSVDPERDTPETLRAYAEKYHADLTNWHFLSGYAFEEIQAFSEKVFKSALSRPAPDTDQFLHGTAFYLINRDGVIVESYHGFGDTPYEQIVKDAKSLQ